jgi:O-antigen/teichoic acid export membrane protein
LQTILITKFFAQKVYGSYGFYVSLSQIILILTQWGFTSWGVNELTKLDKSNLTDLFNGIIISKFIIGGITFILLVTYIIVDTGQIDIALIFAFLFYYLSLVFSLEIMYISLSKIENMLKISLFSKIIYTIIFAYILLVYRVTPQWLFMLFAIQGILNSLFLYVNQSDFKIKFSLFRSKIDQKILNSSSNFILVFSSFLFASGPVIYSGHFLSKDAFAVVYASTAIIKLIQASYQPMIQKILPKLNRGLSIAMDVKLSLLFAFIASTVLFIAAPFIVKIIFNDNYIGIVPAIRLFSLSIIPGILSTIIISQWAIYANKIRLVYVFVVLIALINFIIFTIYSSSLNWQIIIWSMLLSELALFFIVFIILLITERPLTLKFNR